MCRLLAVKSDKEFEIGKHLKIFSELSKNSKEYQGHGWGLAYLDKNNKWQYYKNIKPIWEDNIDQFPKTKLLVVHARSAFEDKDIIIENNMPFYDNKYVFIFNGELRGVRIKEEGRIGAEKIFNFIKKFDNGDIEEALKKAVSQIIERTKYVKSLNIILTDGKNIYSTCNFNEQPDYFQMYYKQGEELIVCSDKYPNQDGWKEIKNGSVKVF